MMHFLWKIVHRGTLDGETIALALLGFFIAACAAVVLAAWITGRWL